MKKLKSKIAVLLAVCLIVMNSVPALAATLPEGGAAETEVSEQTENKILLENDEYEKSTPSNAKYEDIIPADEEDVLEAVSVDEFADIVLEDDIEPDEASPAEAEYEEEFFAEVKVGNVIVTAKAEAGVVPKGTVLWAEKVVDAEVKEAIDEVVEEKRDDEKKVIESLKFDIKLLYNGEEIEPDGPVSISFAIADAAANADVNIYHIKEDKDTEELVEAEALEVETKEEVEEIKEITDEGKTPLVVETVTESFSYYVVEFTVGEYQYVLNGDESVKLSVILAELKISGTVTDAEVSNEKLFTVEKDTEGDDWTVTALKAFSTEEWMKVTIGGKVYEITVTDDNTDISAWDLLITAAKGEDLSNTNYTTFFTVGGGQETATETRTITLKQDITCATPTQINYSIEIPSGKTITIDLDGYTIDRGLANSNTPVDGGRVIMVIGTLNLQDSSDAESGTITGGSEKGNGGGVAVDGTFNMYGGIISGNKVDSATYLSHGGGVYIATQGTFNMSGGTVSENSADGNGKGVYVGSESGGNYGLKLGGIAKITGNGTSNNVDNVYLPTNQTITLGTGEGGNGVAVPTTGFRVGVTTQTAPVAGTSIKITANGTSADTDYFTSDNDAYEVKFNTDHLELAVKPHTHSFTYTADGGVLKATCSGEGCAYKTTPLTLTLTAPASLVYDGNAKAFTFADGESAAWTGAGLGLPTITYAAKSGSSLTDSKAVDAGSYTASITVETDKTASLDFEITKATPYIKNNPAPSEINLGEKLADSTLSDGYVQISSSNTTQVAGLFEWTDPDTIPAIADSETTLYSVTFTPVYENNYNTASCQVKIRVTHTHNPVLVKGQAPTKEKAGYKDYYQCKDSSDACGALFEDVNGTIPIDDIESWKAEGGNGYIPPLPAPATLTLTADKDTYVLGEIMKLTAKIDVTDGTEVYFEFDGGTHRSLTVDGAARCEIPLSKTGEYTVTASAGDSSDQITITVIEKKQTFTVTFIYRNGKENITKTVKHNETIAEPQKPEMSGYTFDCWCSDDGCDNEYKFTSPVTGNLSLYARWKKNEGTEGKVRTENKPVEVAVQTTKQEEKVLLEDLEKNTGASVVSADSLAAAVKDKVKEEVTQTGKDVILFIDTKLTGIKVEDSQTGTAEKTTTLTYDATPWMSTVDSNGIVEETKPISNSDLNRNITLRLPVPKSITEKYVNITHMSQGYPKKTYKNLEIVNKGTDQAYVEIQISHFSTFELTFSNEKSVDPVPQRSNSDSTSTLFTGTWGSPVTNGTWRYDPETDKWSYTTTFKFTDTWGYIANPYAGNEAAWFYFDKNGNMLTGWQLLFWKGSKKWYYFNPVKDSRRGKCQLGGVTPDGWTVDESGAWIESIPRK